MVDALAKKFGPKHPPEFSTQEGCRIKFQKVQGRYVVVDVDSDMDIPTGSKKPDLIVGFITDGREHLAILEMKRKTHDIKHAREQIQAGAGHIQREFTIPHNLNFLPAAIHINCGKRERDIIDRETAKSNFRIAFNSRKYRLIVRRHNIDVVDLVNKRN